jgi:hypothetical protein
MHIRRIFFGACWMPYNNHTTRKETGSIMQHIRKTALIKPAQAAKIPLGQAHARGNI